jgi:hypothetical protein
MTAILTDAPFVVYLIVDPRDGSPFYVGQTRNLERRRKSHLMISEGRQTNRKKRLLDILHEGLELWFIAVEGFQSEEESLAGETRWVKACAKQGYAVCNGWKEHKEVLSLHLQELDEEPAVGIADR